MGYHSGFAIRRFPWFSETSLLRCLPSRLPRLPLKPSLRSRPRRPRFQSRNRPARRPIGLSHGRREKLLRRGRCKASLRMATLAQSSRFEKIQIVRRHARLFWKDTKAPIYARSQSEQCCAWLLAACSSCRLGRGRHIRHWRGPCPNAGFPAGQCETCPEVRLGALCRRLVGATEGLKS